MNFSELKLETSLQAGIDKAGFSQCTPIQEQAMPNILEGRDVAGLAQTGTGKTAAFLIPLMERILRARPISPEASEEEKAVVEKRAFKDWKPQNFILILVPTRELAEQVQENIAKFGETCGLRGTAIYGGTSYDKQRDALKRGVDFVAATPGRLIDLYKEHLVDLKQVRAVVFDEADRMFDMGFKDDMKYILSRIPRERQYLVFSATLNFDVTNTAYQFGADPMELNVSRDQAKAENVKDQIFHISHQEKPGYLLSLLKKNNPKQAIIFTNFKLNVDRIAKFLLDNGVPAMGISSLLTQAQRNKVMEMFKGENNMNVLVATDVAARGLDIQGVDLVINFELPMDPESYVHRIGRTGRAGQTGTAYSLVSDRDVDSLMRIEEFLKHKLETGWIDEAEFVKVERPFPTGEFSPGRILSEALNEGRPPRREQREPRGRDGGGPRRQGGRGGGGGRDRDRDGRDQRDPRDSREPRDQREARGPRGEGQQPRHPDSRGGENRGEHRRGGGGGGRHQPRREGQQGQGGQGGQRSANGEGRRHEGQQRSGPSRGKGQHAPRGPRAAPAPKSLGSKVKGFFKKLFN